MVSAGFWPALGGAERQALDGGHVRLVRRDSWVSKPVEPVILDEPVRPVRKKGKKKNKRFTGCPGRNRKAHQYLQDERTVQDMRWDWTTQSYKHITRTETYRLCAYCDHEQVKTRYGWRNTPRAWYHFLET